MFGFDAAHSVTSAFMVSAILKLVSNAKNDLNSSMAGTF